MKILYVIKLFYLFISIIFLNLGFIKTVYPKQTSSTVFIRENIERTNEYNVLTFNGESISSVDVITEFYEMRGYKPAWNELTIRDLFKEIIAVSKDGLTPSDYHASLVESYIQRLDEGEKFDPSQYALFDIFFTDSLLRLSYHLRYGKVDPELLDPNWNLPKVLEKIPQHLIIEKVLNSGSVSAYIEELKPKHFYYQRMKNALAYYRKIQLKGGWKDIPIGPALKYGMTSERVDQLRKRLIVTGDMEDTYTNNPRLFDKFLESSVKAFQERHGILVDGIAGVQTIKAMNASVDDRINQIRVNLERARWVLQNLPSKFFVVNIAGFTAFFVIDGKPIWTSKVVVGKTYRKTPVFRAEIKYIVFYPSWTVPPIILRKDMLPAVKMDPSYLRKNGIKVLDYNGMEIPQDTINWAAYNWKTFPYILRQDPGPENALGLVKFVFPNKHFVFLHDTPSKSLFEKDVRTFSSGCIRIEKPFELVELLLDDKYNWNSQAIDELISQKITTTIPLQKPVPILVLYWTSRVNEKGKIEFVNDVYERDAAVLRELDAEYN